MNDLKVIAAAAQNSDYATFVDTLGARSRAGFDIGRANRLWLQLTEERITSAFDGGHFQAPQYPAASPVRTNQTVILTDDGTQTAGTVGGDLARFDARPMHAVWVITWQPSDGPKPITLPPNITLVGRAEIVAGQLVLVFPSLKAANVKLLSSTLEVTHANGASRVVAGEPVYAVQAPAVPKPLGTFTIARAKLAPDVNRNDTPMIVISFAEAFAQHLSGLPPAAPGDNSRFPMLTVDGAEVKTPLPGGLIEDAKNKVTYRITQPGSFALPLAGLVPGRRHLHHRLPQLTIPRARPPDAEGRGIPATTAALAIQSPRIPIGRRAGRAAGPSAPGRRRWSRFRSASASSDLPPKPRRTYGRTSRHVDD